MASINTGLPTPSLAINGIETEDSSLTKSFFNVLATGGGFVVGRDLDENLIVISNDDVIKKYPNPVSDSYETNAFVIPTGGIVFLTKQQDQLFIQGVSLVDNAEDTKQYLTTDTGFASLTADEVNNRLIIYKHDTSEGTAGHGYCYIFDYTTFGITQIFDGTVGTDTFIHLASDPVTGDIYRSFQDNINSEIARLNILDSELYNLAPVSGKTNIQNINSDDLYYPTIANGRVYVYNDSMTSISAWNIAVPNTQSQLPIVVDSRTSLFHANSKPYYERLQFDTSTDIIHDTRTFFSYDTIGFVPITDRYPICVEGLVNTDYNVNVSDRQPVRIFSRDSEVAFYRVRDENFVFTLDIRNSCPFFEATLNKYTEISNGPKVLNFQSIQEMVGEVQVGSFTGEPVYLDNNFTITQDGGDLVVNGTSYTITPLAKIEYDDFYYVRTTNDFRRYDGTVEDIYPASALTSAVINSFVFNNKFFVRTSTELSILDLDTQGVSTFSIAYSKSDRVKVFPDPFNDRILLFDKDFASSLYQLNFEPGDFDYTDRPTYLSLSTEIQDSFPSVIATNDPSTAWEIAAITPELIAFMDYDNQIWQIVFQTNSAESFGSFTSRGVLEAPPSMLFNGIVLFSRNTEEVFIMNRRGSEGTVPQTSFVTENQDLSLPLIPNTDSKLGVYIDNEGFMQWLTSGIGNAAPNTSYIVNFNRSGPRRFETVPPLNTLQFTLLDSARGVTILQFSILENEIFDGEYKIDVPIKLQRQSFGNNSAVSATEAKEVLKSFKLSVVVDSDKLARLQALFSLQWSLSADNQSWEILFDDLIYSEEPPSVRPVIINGDFVRHTVAITGFDWKWWSKDEFFVDLTFSEVGIHSDQFNPI